MELTLSKVFSDKGLIPQYIFKNSGQLFKITTILLALLLISLQLYRAFNGPIWRDDAYFGIVAKHLANGDGYKAVYFDKSYLFHYGISAGPLLILPAALLVYFFGNQSWVLGFTNILLIWGLLVSIFIYSKHFMGAERRWKFCFLALLFAVIFSNSPDIYPYGFDFRAQLGLWHLLLGEIPSTLLIILGTMILFSAQDNHKKVLIGALVLGLATMIKTVTLISIAVILGVKSFTILLNKFHTNKVKILLIVSLGFTTISPILMFEATKYISLGSDGYAKMEAQNAGYYAANSLVYKPRYGNNMWAKPKPKLKVFNFKNHVGMYAFFGFLIGQFYIIYLCFRNKPDNDNDKYIRTAGLALILGFFIHMLWWFFCATENTRYFITALLSYITGIVLLISIIRYKNKLELISIIFLIIFLISSRADAISYIFNNGFKVSQRLEEQKLVANNIDLLQKKGITIFSCGNNFELEYLIRNSNNFKECSGILDDNSPKNSLLVTYFSYPGQVMQTGANDYYSNSIKIPDKIAARCNKNFARTQHISLDLCNTNTK